MKIVDNPLLSPPPIELPRQIRDDLAIHARFFRRACHIFHIPHLRSINEPWARTAVIHRQDIEGFIRFSRLTGLSLRLKLCSTTVIKDFNRYALLEVPSEDPEHHVYTPFLTFRTQAQRHYRLLSDDLNFRSRTFLRALLYGFRA